MHKKYLIDKLRQEMASYLLQSKCENKNKWFEYNRCKEIADQVNAFIIYIKKETVCNCPNRDSPD